MKCRYCGTDNDPDGKFCKECGQKLETASPDAKAADSHLRIGELIYAAYKHKEAGRLDDAILACQGALALNENSAPAHSLLGSLYELKGNIEEAIREYELAVRLNPDSPGDLKKLEDLRSGRFAVAQPADGSSAETLRPYWPFAAAVISLCLVLIVGLGLMRAAGLWSSGDKESASDDMSAQGNVRQTAPIQPYGPQYVPGQPYPTQPPAGGPIYQPGQQSPSAAPSAGDAPRTTGTTTRSMPPQPTVRPLPTAETDSSRRTSAAPDATRQPPPIVPMIESVERPSTRPNVVVTPPPPPPAGDPEKRAQQLQKDGKYREAINAYREALNTTSDLGRTYQQMAISYQRLGESSMAVDSYNRAISSYRDQLAAGRDAAEVQRAIAACESGIKASTSR